MHKAGRRKSSRSIPCPRLRPQSCRALFTSLICARFITLGPKERSNMTSWGGCEGSRGTVERKAVSRAHPSIIPALVPFCPRRCASERARTLMER
ncbi:hypothetical protein BCV69DRAFT_110731 [Microstroma glucosiphilum]|uniref:Uncharacterized protein n=1 Tax=Pseudomicrostroma glucosiphilum TaxID=1684307 RepID=A0A316UD41_9BASI|nr:hypothetical protein BCV69DRAFT_110731 [Pseudomicrostroma glucosiphilum]PWN23157.1 hypothetical protein BCV69DRAFT_110731 [Pseudomicrostroma glucosiphilum]